MLPSGAARQQENRSVGATDDEQENSCGKQTRDGSSSAPHIAVQSDNPHAGTVPVQVGIFASFFREACDERTAETGEQPERRPGPLAAAQDAKDGGRQRQQSDEDDGVRRGDVLERQRRQQRKADDNAERDNHQGNSIGAGRVLLLEGEQQAKAEQRNKEIDEALAQKEKEIMQV